MAKKKPDDPTTSVAPEAIAPIEAPLAQAFPGLATTDVNGEVRCIGGGPYDGTWRVPLPLPRDLSAGRAIYNLSAPGVYVYRVP